MIRKTLNFFTVTLTLLLFLSPVPSNGGVNPVETILDGRTAFRWGRDFLVWAVHYPEDMVDPWVRSRTGGAGDPTGKMAEDFRCSLKMDKSTPVLLSLHSYTDRAIELKPLSEKFFLQTSDGERLAPTSYDNLFDSPITGLVQGLVFFPLVEGPFELVLFPDRGGELTFEFPEDRDNRLRKEVTEKVKKKSEIASVAEVQEMQIQAEEIRKKELEDNRNNWEGEKSILLKQIEALSCQKALLRERLDETLAELVKKQKPLFAEQKKVILPEVSFPSRKKEEAPIIPGFSRNQIMKLFLVAWKKGDSMEMLNFLSPAFREEIESSEDLEALLKERSLPGTLPLDSKLVDEGDKDEAKVIFAQKLLVIRTLRSVSLKLSELQGGWYISSLE